MAQSVECSGRDMKVSGSTLSQTFYKSFEKFFYCLKSWQKMPTCNDFLPFYWNFISSCSIIFTIWGTWILNISRKILDKLTKKAYLFAKNGCTCNHFLSIIYYNFDVYKQFLKFHNYNEFVFWSVRIKD